MPGVFIDVGGALNSHSKFFLKALKELCYGQDIQGRGEAEYAKRLRRHYQQFRQKLQQNAQEEDEVAFRTIPKPYDPCPCVSGKKYKFCCSPIFLNIMEAMCAAEDGLHETAVAWMAEAERIVGNTAEVLCRKAIVYSFFDKKKHDEYLQKCLEVNPQHPRAHYLQGIDFKDKGEYEAAIAAYLRSIQYYLPTDNYHLNEAYHNLGCVYHQIGEQAKAVAAWKKALEYSPTDKMTQKNLKEFGLQK